MASMTFSRNGNGLVPIAAAIALLLPYACQGNFPLASIPTHHGINLDSLHLNERGGAVATRKHNWKHYRPRNTLPCGELGTSAPTVITSSLEPAEKYVVKDVKPEAVTKLDASTTIRKQHGQRDGLTPTAIACMSLLALQFGIQPILVRKFTPQTIVRSSVVLVQEIVKFGIAGAMYVSGTKKETREKDYQGWSVKTWIALAGLPAFLYTIQNVAALMAYQNLEALTFNVLNQTKILSAALSCYFVMGQRQSKMQVISLCFLILSTLVIEQILHPFAFISLRRGNAVRGIIGAFTSLGAASGGAGRRVTHGIVPLLVASLISGMAGALTQKNLQGSRGGSSIWGRKRNGNASSPAVRAPRNAYLFSMEMNVASAILLLASLCMSSDGRRMIRSRTYFSNWTPETFIPVITNSIGGILVGLVTKHAGSVRKGFALIFGLLLSGMFQASGVGIQAHHIIGGLMAAASLWMYTIHPFVPGSTVKTDKEQQ
ncbi:hypothetical protein ACHAXH_008714 [Discostella pseudostelligera]